jgi:putative hydrolase of the HAD superfamily
MNAVSERILLYMIQKVGIPPDDATLKKRYYYQHYGTALQGLLHEYQVDPVDYLNFVHDLKPSDFFGASPPLNRMLEAIPLPKAIFTNADQGHSQRVLETLQVRPHFELIIDIQRLNYHSKPNPQAYQQVLEILGVPAESCIMVEDSARNLIPAKDLGMTTILVEGEAQSAAIDYVAPTIFHVERVLRKLLPQL